MAEVISVRFKEVGKNYYFDPNGIKVKCKDKVIVDTARGLECGEVTIPNREIPDDELKSPLKKVLRIATERDLETVAQNKIAEKEAFTVCQKKIAAHKLEMKLVDVDFAFDRSKIIFYFTADGRIDFRELVKDLAGHFRTRIELRQIGVRDVSKKIGGLGICGRPFCCNSFLGDFQPVSIKMAKEQSLSLSPIKISGTCGRLMCCLKYEQEAYEHLLKVTPKCGAIVETNEGKGTVVDVNLLTGVLKVSLEKKREAAPLIVNRKDVKLIRDSRIKVDKKEIEALKDIEG